VFGGIRWRYCAQRTEHSTGKMSRDHQPLLRPGREADSAAAAARLHHLIVGCVDAHGNRCPVSSTPEKPESRSVVAIGLVLAAMFAFAVMDGLTKILTDTLPIPQILWVRNIVFAAMAIALLRGQNRNSSLVALARSATPVPMLGEKVGPRRWAAVMVGFAGVLLIVRPGFEKIEPTVLIALLGAAMWSLYQIMVRQCSRVDRPETTSLWTALVGLGASTLVGPASWVWPDTKGWAMLAAIALMGSMSHIALIRALGMTQPSLLQPYNYSLFVWAVVVGYLFFGDVPDRWTLAGAAIVIASGLYAWHRERVRAAAA
jgi:uncharacterized membrane protein